MVLKKELKILTSQEVGHKKLSVYFVVPFAVWVS